MTALTILLLPFCCGLFDMFIETPATIIPALVIAALIILYIGMHP